MQKKLKQKKEINLLYIQYIETLTAQEQYRGEDIIETIK